MIAVLLSALAGYGVHLFSTRALLGWDGLAPGPRPRDRARSVPLRRRAQQWLAQAGLDDVRPTEFGLSLALLGAVGATAGAVLFAAPLPALVTAAFAASFPIAAHRARRRARRSAAQEAWPHMIEEIRLRTSSLGRSIPQALLEVGRRGPEEMRGAFRAAEREWLVSTDFPRTVSVLKQRLADPTADAACETLLVAHEVGGSDLDRRLRDLIEDRIQDVQGRKDARAKQAGVRFARRFVLIVPLGMAAVGLSIGGGREAYAQPVGQIAVVVAILMVVACWAWAGRLMRLPEQERVFDR